MRFNASATTAFSGTATVGRTGRVAENCWPCPSQLRSRRVTIGSAANTSPDTTLYRARHARAAIWCDPPFCPLAGSHKPGIPHDWCG
jgi:hypothetical protein